MKFKVGDRVKLLKTFKGNDEQWNEDTVYSVKAAYPHQTYPYDIIAVGSESVWNFLPVYEDEIELA